MASLPVTTPGTLRLWKSAATGRDRSNPLPPTPSTGPSMQSGANRDVQLPRYTPSILRTTSGTTSKPLPQFDVGPRLRRRGLRSQSASAVEWNRTVLLAQPVPASEKCRPFSKSVPRATSVAPCARFPDWVTAREDEAARHTRRPVRPPFQASITHHAAPRALASPFPGAVRHCFCSTGSCAGQAGAGNGNPCRR